MTKRSERRAQRKRAARSTFRVSASAASPPIGPTFTSDDDYRAEGERALRRLTFAVCLSMVSFGCATGAIAGALLHLESANTALGALTAGVKSRVIAATPLGALIGALVAGPFGDKTGRRSSILVGNALFLLGAGLMFTAVTPTQLTCGRLCAGLAVGFSTSLCTVYIGECAPAAQRGQLSSYAPLGVTVGILAAYFVSLAADERGRRVEAHAGDVRAPGGRTAVHKGLARGVTQVARRAGRRRGCPSLVKRAGAETRRSRFVEIVVPIVVTRWRP
jgi:hypothetical protein